MAELRASTDQAHRDERKCMSIKRMNLGIERRQVPAIAGLGWARGPRGDYTHRALRPARGGAGGDQDEAREDAAGP